MTSVLMLALVMMVPGTGGGGTPLPALSGQELEIHAVHQKFVDNWNHHDAAALAGMWTEQGDYTEPDGRTVFGRAEVQRLYGYEHRSVFKESSLTLVVERVRFVADGVAIADGSYELFNARDPRGRPIGIRSGYFTTVVVKKDGEWKVSAARLMLPQVLIWREQE